jgi:hypothetical protein
MSNLVTEKLQRLRRGLVKITSISGIIARYQAVSGFNQICRVSLS